MGDRATILGDGQLGLVAADVLRQNGHRATIWSPVADEAARLLRTRASDRLPGHRIHADITIETDPGRALEGASFVFSAIPTQYLRQVIGRLAPCLPTARDPIMASATKGIEVCSGLRPSELWLELAGTPSVVVSGPNIATELAREQPAAMVAASADPRRAAATQEALSRPWLRVYTNDDPVGVELCGALKNVIALAAGMLDGLEAGYNAKSMLLARGLAEMRRFGMAFGARDDTFSGLAGVGDLATTCFCPEGRNRSTGEALARGKSLQEILAGSHSVIEGVPTARAVVERAAGQSLDVPIAVAVHAVCEGRTSPRDALAQLMGRSPRGE